MQEGGWGLKRVCWEDYVVVYAVFFGPASRGCKYRDVDVVVLSRDDFSCYLIESVVGGVC